MHTDPEVLAAIEESTRLDPQVAVILAELAAETVRLFRDTGQPWKRQHRPVPASRRHAKEPARAAGAMKTRPQPEHDQEVPRAAT